MPEDPTVNARRRKAGEPPLGYSWAVAGETYTGPRFEDLEAPAGHVFVAVAVPEGTLDAAAARVTALEHDGDAEDGLEVAEQACPEVEVALPPGVSAERVAESIARRLRAETWDSAVRTWIIPGAHILPYHGELVICGPARAVWRVVSFEEAPGYGDGRLIVGLEPVDMHDVPPTAHVRELPRPLAVVATPLDAFRPAVSCGSRFRPNEGEVPDFVLECDGHHDELGRHGADTIGGRYVWRTVDEA